MNAAAIAGMVVSLCAVPPSLRCLYLCRTLATRAETYAIEAETQLTLIRAERSEQ